jgi:hypothetical protein
VFNLIAAKECGKVQMKNTLNPYQSQQVTYLIMICCYDPLTTDLIFIRVICDKIRGGRVKNDPNNRPIFCHRAMLTPLEDQPFGIRNFA